MRSDIVPLRLVDCEYVESVVSFAEPQQYFSGITVQKDHFDRLPELLAWSAAGIMIRNDGPESDPRVFSRFVESELDNRLSFSWLMQSAKPRQTLAIIEGGRVHPRNGGTGPSVYLAAKALGLDVVVMDNAGHWLEGSDYSHWRKEFIPLKLTDPPQPDFTERIVKSVKECGIRLDGIMTLCESYMFHVAEACERLGLPTQPPAPYLTATNKFKTSVFEGHKAHRATSVKEALAIASSGEMPYPLIIKPTNGWSSEGVFRVDDYKGVENAVKSIDTTRHGTEFVMEPYCSGPEVDANFFLLDGKILFFEVCDDFPKSADINGSGSLGTFIELDSVFPSALPKREIEVLRDSFHATLLRMGFDTGMYHLEGRVDKSSFEYYTSHDGIVDLHARSHSNSEPPTAWLIEINPRPPGMAGTQIIESTYGIDYWSITQLAALRDDERIRALTQPYKRGPQYTCIMVFIPTEYDASCCEGVFDSEDICAELLTRRPDLARNISKCGCLINKGQKVAHPSTGYNSFVAYFNVFSREGREKALVLAKEVREQVRFVFR